MNNLTRIVNNKYQRLLYLLVVTLVFEGMVRKIVPSFISQLVFFLKDIFCLIALYHIAHAKKTQTVIWFFKKWQLLFVLFVPLLLYTTVLDLPLGLFAAKQYLSYIVVGLLVPLSFSSTKFDDFKYFVNVFTFLIVPTLTIAVLQNSLPSSHWLNLSIGGESLEAFSAGGYLRVSSTFSFTGQYSWFLNAVCAFLAVRLFLQEKEKSIFKTLQPIVLGVFLIVSAFITGGRTAVLGNAACILVGFVLFSYKSPSNSIRKIVLVGIILVPGFFALRSIKPEFFAAYEVRSSGTSTVSHEKEIQTRVIGTYLGWIDTFGEQDIISILIGNGLGIMSNGSDKISSYARAIRSGGFWTEGDIPTTAWEGGLYLLIVWYGFRLSVVLFCFKLWLSIKDLKFSASASFLLANVFINGIYGTIGFQPPVAIWWWLSIGSLVAIRQFDAAQLANKVKLKQNKSLVFT